MSNPRPSLSLKKTFFYKFFPSKEEEEACKVNNTPWMVTPELIEIRDIYPPWRITKKITHDEIVQEMLVIPLFETIEYIFRYWTFDMAKSLVEIVQGCTVRVNLWDVTGKNVCKKYEDGNVYLRKLHNHDYSLSCMELLNDRRLGVGDEIGLFWHPGFSILMFKLLSKAS